MSKDKSAKQTNQKLWFRSKLYGWGWYPSSIEGWLVIGVFALCLIALASSITPDTNPFFYLAKIAFLVLALLLICAKKGEKPRWRWGR